MFSNLSGIFSARFLPTRTVLSQVLNSKSQLIEKRNFLFTNQDKIKSIASNRSMHTSVFNSSNIQIVDKGKLCAITWDDDFQSVFHSAWLRINCHCEKCRHKNGQKLLDPTKVRLNLPLDAADIKDDKVEIVWKGGNDHKGFLPLEFLRKNNYNDETLWSINDAVKMEKSIKEIPTADYQSIMNSDTDYLRWLEQINESGLSIVKDVPPENGMVKKVGERIAPLWVNIYGELFDVVLKEDPINVAYSNHALAYHMDLVYFESPPGLQLLHCLSFDDTVEGGLSIFLDSFTHAEEFRVKYPEHFDTLTKIPATFQKVHYERENPVDLVNQKPHIKLNHNGEIVAVYWAPAFEGPLCVQGKDVERYYAAYELFAKEMDKSPHQLRHQLRPGELVIFNNIRMLHGRTAFRGKGLRKLQGCYINIDFFKSRTQVMKRLIGDGSLVKRVGNQCWR